VNTANRSFYETFQVSAPETAQSPLFELGNGQWNIPQLLLRGRQCSLKILFDKGCSVLW